MDEYVDDMTCRWQGLVCRWHLHSLMSSTYLYVDGVHIRDMTHSYVWHDSFIWVTWLIHMCDLTHSYVWLDSFICVTRLIHMCHMTHSYVWHDQFICVTWLMHMCDMTHSYVWHDSMTCGSPCHLHVIYIAYVDDVREYAHMQCRWHVIYIRHTQCRWHVDDRDSIRNVDDMYLHTL